MNKQIDSNAESLISQWTPFEAVTWIVLWQILMTGLSFAGAWLWIGHSTSTLGSAFLGNLAAAVVLVRWLKRRGAHWLVMLWGDGFPWRTSALAAVVGVFVAWFISLTGLGVPRVDVVISAALSSPLQIALLLMTVVVAAPLMEEFLFRGLLQTASVAAWGPLVGGSIAAAGFVLLHSPNIWSAPWSVIPYLILSAIMTLTYELTRKSVGACAIIHSVYNLALLFWFV